MLARSGEGGSHVDMALVALHRGDTGLRGKLTEPSLCTILMRLKRERTVGMCGPLAVSWV